MPDIIQYLWMKHENKKIVYACVFPVCFILLLWLIKTIEWGFDARTFPFGIYPRQGHGLIGIITGPLVHSDFSHLFSNSVPLFILGWCLSYFYTTIAYRSFFLVWITAGFITWCIGRDAWHVGASGIVYGLCFFLFFSGILRKHTPLTAVSMLVAFLYGSMLWNMLPITELIEKRTSWEGHLAGAMAGSFWAVAFRNIGPQKPKEQIDEEDEEDERDESDEEMDEVKTDVS